MYKIIAIYFKSLLQSILTSINKYTKRIREENRKKSINKESINKESINKKSINEEDINKENTNKKNIRN